MKQIDTSGLSFIRLREEDMYYVDKSLLIKDIIESNRCGIYLFTRPRRFGKTTNLSMLDAFFNIKYKGNAWFDDLAISQYPEFEGYRNAYPVISLNMKNAKAPDYEGFLDAMRTVVLDALKKHLYLLDYNGLTPDEHMLFDALFSRSASSEQLRSSIGHLSNILERYHEKKVIILIDEYDRAVSDMFGEESHRPIMEFLGEFMNYSLKNNDSVQMAYVTGIMQIAKESIFSDLNNIIVDNIFSTISDERFGFTETEVKQILSYYSHPERFEEVKQWYDGYRFGDAEVYNPFSVMSYIMRGFKPSSYWVNSGGDAVLRWMLGRINGSNFSRILGLVEGGSLRTDLTSSLRYASINTRDVPLYSLMVMSGYLKAVPAENGQYDLSVPNREVAMMIDELMKDMIPIDEDLFLDFNRAVLDCDAVKMTSFLQAILMEGSYLNLNAENSYSLVLMTLMHALTKRYEVKTEYETGNGRADIVLKPRYEGTTSMIFELKKVDSDDLLDRGVEDALDQIRDRRYHMGMPGKVALIGMSFFGKIPKVAVEIVDNGPDGFSYA